MTLIIRATDFFHAEFYQLTAGGVVRLDLPTKINLQGLLDGKLVFTTLEDWPQRPTRPAISWRTRPTRC